MRRSQSASFRIQARTINAATPPALDLAFLIVGTQSFPFAACANRDPEMWSDKQALHSGLTVRGREAVAVCDRCVHETECLQWALDNEEQHGILGGLTPIQRKELMK